MAANPSNLQNPNAGYSYKKPRNINWVSLLLGAAGILAAYFAYQFGPIYWKRYKVDRVLQEAATESDSIAMMNRDTQLRMENDARAKVYQSLQGMGLSPTPVEEGGNGLVVVFDDGYKNIHATYTITVNHPFGKRSVMKFHRKEKVPTNMKFKR